MLKTATLLYAADTDRVDPDIDLEKWFVNSKYAEMKFSELIEMIYPNYPDQQDFLKQYLGNKEIGDGHRGIANFLSSIFSSQVYQYSQQNLTS